MIAFIIIFFLSLGLTYLARRIALQRQILDLPNERSSHTLPTPRGGGISIVISFTLVCMIMFYFNQISHSLFYALTFGGLVVAAVSLIDDIYSLSNKIRLAAHFLVAFWALYWLNGYPVLDLGTLKIAVGYLGYIIAALGIVWLINLYNFMDGIDGLAGIEGVFTAIAGSIALWLLNHNDYATLMLLLAAAIAGFAIFNWPPARIFMGDVGSSYLGYVIAVIGIATANENIISIPFWLILLGVFICDATFTIAFRAWNRKLIYSAHREHAYQHLNICGLSHKHISLSVLFINTFILMPLAFEVLNEPKKSIWLLLAMIAGLLITWIYIKRLPIKNVYSEVSS